ncbi:hypothetical protein SAMN05421642_101569 [Rhodococcoides kyotonense]|uniref:Uncharacterized protein n=1 Tax=Rhodococcoides kyotonense TaxID=398843 RepID=A0A239DIS0_9NOCA|nr:hypothetical protein SAMN05421642_101569 [Rhodococcus kyotonensis]
MRATNPVIRPSRGPGPIPAPMYNAVANPLITMPDTIIGILIASESTSGSQFNDTSTAIAMTTTLLTVPSPGFCRNGIHTRSTAIPVSAVIVPKLRSTCRPTPW